jgi:hypothetical protein
MLAAAVFFGSAVPHPPAPVALACHEGPDIDGLYPYALPDTHYLYTDAFGWFDRSHFNTGRPDQVLADVRAAVTQGGIITIRQGIHDDITGYTATYAVSDSLTPAEATSTALGIYLDWSLRFESWQGDPPQGLLGPSSTFAVEDLPSQYLGFVAAAFDVPVGRLFACYLGPVTGSNEGPPDFVPADLTLNHDDGWAGFARLDNQTFDPLVPTASGWIARPWPPELQLTPLPTGSQSWRFLTDETWFLGDDNTNGAQGRRRPVR